MRSPPVSINRAAPGFPLSSPTSLDCRKGLGASARPCTGLPTEPAGEYIFIFLSVVITSGDLFNRAINILC
jgi:hypothetical protein